MIAQLERAPPQEQLMAMPEVRVPIFSNPTCSPKKKAQAAVG